MQFSPGYFVIFLKIFFLFNLLSKYFAMLGGTLVEGKGKKIPNLYFPSTILLMC